LFGVIHEKNKELNVYIDGQPVMNVGLSFQKQPETLKVNGKLTPVKINDGILNIKLNLKDISRYL
jgi:hypothetical protein